MRAFFARFLAVAGLALALPVSAMPVPAQAETITLRADSWCPYNCEPGSDKPGYMIEIARAVFEPKGITVDYQLLPWSRAVEEVKAGKFTGAVGGTPDDAPGFVFTTRPLGVSTNVLAARKGEDFRYTGTDSLAGRKLAAVQDYAYSEDLDAHIAAGKGIELSSGDNVTLQNIRKLLGGRVDLVLEDVNVLEYTLSGEGLVGLVDIHETGTGADLYIAFSPADPKSPDYAKMLDEGLAELRADGRLAAILSRYGLKDWE